MNVENVSWNIWEFEKSVLFRKPDEQELSYRVLLKKGSNYLLLPVICVLQMKEVLEETRLTHGPNEMLPEGSRCSVNENVLLEKESVKG